MDTEFVPDPMTGRPTDRSSYDRMYRPVVLALPNPDAARRIRLINEVTEAIADAHRNGTLRTEDLQFIERLQGGLEELLDVNGHLRIRPTNMTNEQLLALGERIGTNPTGLNEETISARVAHRKFQSSSIEPPREPKESCYICQKEYVHEDDIAKLECGHEFHFACVKTWLSQKNECPSCKRAGIRV